MDSILDTIKKMLGIPTTDTAFDVDIITNINSVFMILNQLGVGPTDPYSITDSTETWDDFLSTDVAIYPAVRSYIFLKVKLMFDPPNTSFVLNAVENQCLELEYRLRSQMEMRIEPVDPVVPE